MTTTNEHTSGRNSGWHKLSQWLKAFDESFDYDPVDPSVDRLIEKISQLEDTVRDLGTQLAVGK